MGFCQFFPNLRRADEQPVGLAHLLRNLVDDVAKGTDSRRPAFVAGDAAVNLQVSHVNPLRLEDAAYSMLSKNSWVVTFLPRGPYSPRAKSACMLMGFFCDVVTGSP